ncbi:tyrosine-type recombinase/integrase [Phycisphaerales bacterium AB-hyl4]|uniref:Tyrosine-type recombinase/integrase n=1 Tax=Natronomicrosphaera hydrolytica TaxID=3242702 RepID=A0ABV4U5L0_9BACT
MKLANRHACEGTVPRITIGQRVYRRADGSRYVSNTWTAQWSYEGKHHYEALQTRRKDAALRKAFSICERIRAGEVKPKKYALTIAEMREKYLDLKRGEGRAPKTVQKYEAGLLSLVAWSTTVGRRSATSFTADDFWRYNRWLADNGASEKTRYDRLILIKQAFKWAHKQKLLAENPLVGVSLSEPTPTEQPCFTPDQVSTLLREADPHEAAIYATMAYLGLRIGEVRELRWSDILFDAGEHGVVVVRRGGSGGTTKNRGVRRIPLNPALKPYLDTVERKFERVFTARPSPKHPAGGSPISERRLLLSLKRLCKRCGFNNPNQYKLHTFRHVFASMCARSNIAYKYALTWLGHSDSKILDIYYTMFDDVAGEAMQTIVYPTQPPSKPPSEGK